MAMTNPSETQANRWLQAPIRLPSHCTIPLILSEWSPFPGSEFPVLSIISCGSCFSHIPYSCKTQPSSPQNSCSWPRYSLLHARSAALRHYLQLGLGHSVMATILCAVGCLAAPLVPAPWMSVASPPPTPVMPIKAVPKLYQRPLGDKTTLLGNRRVRLWPLPQVTCGHQTIVPHLHAAFSGSPVSATKTHSLCLALEASHPQPPDC